MDPFFEREERLIRVLYKEVKNVNEIRKLVLTASLPFCLLKPRYIVDDFQLSVAITKAQYNKKEKTMVTKSFPAELIYCLSPSRNISESLKTFGVGENDTEVLVVGEEALFNSIRSSIQGEEIEVTEVKNYTDVEGVMSLYQISREELRHSTLLNSVISRMSSKDYANMLSSPVDK